MKFICDMCYKSFTAKRNLTRHIKNDHTIQNFECVTCKRKYKRSDYLKQHQDLMQGKCTPVRPPPPTPAPAPSSSLLPTGASASSTSSSVSSLYCTACQRNVIKKCWPYHQRTNEHKRNSGIPLNEHFKTLRTGFSERIQSLFYENKNEGELNVDKFLEEVKLPLIELLREMLIKHTALKFNIELFAEYVKMTDETAMIDIKSHQPKMIPVLKSTEVSSILDDMFNSIKNKMSEFQERDSGWTLIKITHVEININQYQPLRGSNFIMLPDKIRKKNACINVQNNDVYCFKWAIISALKKLSKKKYGARTGPCVIFVELLCAKKYNNKISAF